MNLYRLFRKFPPRRGCGRTNKVYVVGGGAETVAVAVAPSNAIVIPQDKVEILSDCSKIVLYGSLYYALQPVATTHTNNLLRLARHYFGGGGGGDGLPFEPNLDIIWLDNSFIIPFYSDFYTLVNSFVPVSLEHLFETVATEVDETVLDNIYQIMTEINQNIRTTRSRSKHIHLCTKLINAMSSRPAPYSCGRRRSISIYPMIGDLYELYL